MTNVTLVYARRNLDSRNGAVTVFTEGTAAIGQKVRAEKGSIGIHPFILLEFFSRVSFLFLLERDKFPSRAFRRSGKSRGQYGTICFVDCRI